ncbi:WAT1-related protein At2g39510-like [Lolium perenne]|uniref:WAT1-related protein At2g39510-like n=1 Tax=Lolium perenne TaxID=4522 RepID=UPI0021F652E0|nr:WAT1-related protein At2g39510-like [Lolium perenne]
MAVGMGGEVWRRYAPHNMMILVQLSYTFMYFFTEAAFNRGLNPYVYVTYRHLLVAVVLWPFAYYHEKKLRPKMTWMLFLEIFVLSLVGVSLTLNMYFASLKYTSPTFVASMVNAVASITFVIAIVLRMEIVDVKSARGLAKVGGTVVSFAGVTTMTLYKGTAIASPWKAPIHIDGSNAVHQSWLKGAFLAVASCVCWSIWYIMQATSVKRYPAELSLTAWMATVGGIQSLAFTVILKHHKEDWLIGFGLKFWCIIYSGIACSGFAVFAQLWCTKKKGPVFVTMSTPLSTIMVAILAYFIFGENLYVGSIIGGVVVILGLYMLLWGKDKDQQYNASSEERVADLDCEMQRANITNVSPGKSGSEEDSNTTRQEGIYCHSHE